MRFDNFIIISMSGWFSRSHLNAINLLNIFSIYFFLLTNVSCWLYFNINVEQFNGTAAHTELCIITVCTVIQQEFVLRGSTLDEIDIRYGLPVWNSKRTNGQAPLFISSYFFLSPDRFNWRRQSSKSVYLS